MGLFGKRGGIFGDPLGGGLFNDEPNVLDQVEMLFIDVETEGKKQGYDRAAREYEKAYRGIEREFLETKKIIELQKNSYDNEVDMLIHKLEELEIEKANLENQVNEKTREVSSRFGIPAGDIKKSLATGSLFVDNPYSSVNVLGLVYKHKEKKLKEVEQRGYAEAKKLYENKIEKLKSELSRLKENGNRDLQKLVTMIDEIFAAIADEQMKIAELRILL